MITLIIQTLKGVHHITGDKYDKVMILELIKVLKEKGLSIDEIFDAIKSLYLL